MNYKDHDYILERLIADQEAEEDLRDEIDEIELFVDGDQWEQDVWDSTDGRPRYTFDMQNATINRIWNEMAANEYSATTQPIGGGADEDTSNIIDGLIRNIYNISCSDDISANVGKKAIKSGFACSRLTAQFVGESFYQDIVEEPIFDSHRRVWFDCNSEKRTREDAMHCFVMAEMTREAAEKKYPKFKSSVETSRKRSGDTHKRVNNVVVGEILYKEPYKKTIYLLDDKQSSVVDSAGLLRMQENFQAVTVVDEREADCFRVYSRKFDGAGWLTDEKEVAFDFIPIIPEYANHEIRDGKFIYRGCVRGQMDAQRVFNYSESRKIEESVLSPRRKTWVDDRVAEGYVDELSDINRNPSAVQLFNGARADEATHAPIFETGGPNTNPAITEISNDMIRNMSLNSNLPSVEQEMMSTGRDSDLRAEQRNSIGQMGTFEYYRAHKTYLEYKAKVLLSGIPRIYDTSRKIRTVDEAGASSEEMINFPDAEGNIINNLVMGKYDITVKVGKQFQSRQAEANDGIFRIGDYAPDVVSRSTDIIASNTDAPGMQQVADRERALLMKQGLIPESQWTDEEKQQAALAAQNQQPDPAAMIAQAEMEKARAETDRVQTQLLIEQAKLEQKQIEIQLSQSKASNDSALRAMDLELKQQKQAYDNLKTSAEILKIMNESGVDESELMEIAMLEQEIFG